MLCITYLKKSLKVFLITIKPEKYQILVCVAVFDIEFVKLEQVVYLYFGKIFNVTLSSMLSTDSFLTPTLKEIGYTVLHIFVAFSQQLPVAEALHFSKICILTCHN